MRTLTAVVLSAAVLQPVIAAPDFEAMGRQVVAELASGAFDQVAARFDEKVAAGLPASKLAAIWNALTKQAGPVSGVTAVRMESAGNMHVVDLTTAFERGSIIVRLAFSDDGRIGGLFLLPTKAPVADWKPPAYATESAFTEIDVAVGKFALPGTLTLPKSQKPVPAVVLVHGSGPQDRDETIGAHKVFKDLAWGLASRGIAVLRYDKRSLRVPMKTGTVKDEVLDDARDAVVIAAGHPAVDRRNVFVVGHSLGGMLAPRLVAADSTISGLIILAGTTRPVDEVIIDQVRYLRGDKSKEMEQAQQFAQRLKDPTLRADTSIAFMGVPMPAEYWIDLRDYRPAQAAAKLRVPMLILQGGRDYQSTTADFDGWSAALKGRPDVTLNLYSSLNHLFVAGEGRSTPDEYFRPGHVDQRVITDIADWIQKR